MSERKELDANIEGMGTEAKAESVADDDKKEYLLEDMVILIDNPSKRVREALECNVCFGPKYNAMMRSCCNKSFCKKCVDASREKCLGCNTVAGPSNPLVKHVDVNSMMEDCPAKCLHPDCTASATSLTVGTMVEHLRSECKLLRICVCQRSFSFPRMFNLHIATCGSVSIPCAYCSKVIKRCDMPNHGLTDCVAYPVSCTECHWSGKRSEIKLHACPAAAIKQKNAEIKELQDKLARVERERAAAAAPKKEVKKKEDKKKKEKKAKKEEKKRDKVVIVECKALDSHCRILGIKANATSDEVKEAFKVKARVLHPDKGIEPDGDKFRELMTARNTLLQQKELPQRQVKIPSSCFPGPHHDNWTMMPNEKKKDEKEKKSGKIDWLPADYSSGGGGVTRVFVCVYGGGGALALDKDGKVQMRYKLGEANKIYFAKPANIIFPVDDQEEESKTSSASSSSSASHKDSARDLIQTFEDDSIVCFTDGACIGNPGPCGAGAVVCFPLSSSSSSSSSSTKPGARMALLSTCTMGDARVGIWHERWRALGQGTNNIGELTAISLALEMLSLSSSSSSSSVHILTDSQCALGVLTKNWKAKLNIPLITHILHQIKQIRAVRPVSIHWVKGHAGVPGNERADVIAGLAARQQYSSEDFDPKGKGTKRKHGGGGGNDPTIDVKKSKKDEESIDVF